MRHLTVLLLTGFLAGTASASIIKSDPDIDLTVTGQNVQLSNIIASINPNGPLLDLIVFQDGTGSGNKDVSVKATMTSYVTVTGGVGAGTMTGGVMSSDCDAVPSFVLQGCFTLPLVIPTHFTFGVPAPITLVASVALSGAYPFGRGEAAIGGLFVGFVKDSDGNPIDSPIFTYSATATPVASVDNPEPGTWGLLACGLAALAYRRIRASRLKSA